MRSCSSEISAGVTAISMATGPDMRMCSNALSLGPWAKAGRPGRKQ